MKAIKMRAANEEEAKSVQDYLFSLGYKWDSGLGEGYQFLDKKYFFGYSEGYLTKGDDYHNGDKYYEQHRHEEVFLPPTLSEKHTQISDKPIKSDGGSSSYYSFDITNKAGQTITVEVADVIRCMVGDNFALGNIVKATRRMYKTSQGSGKDGVSIEYDANKCGYFAQEFSQWNKG